MTKPCPRCHRRLPLAAFAPDPRRAQGLAIWCKACQAHASRVRYQRGRGYLAPPSWPPRPRQAPEEP